MNVDLIGYGSSLSLGLGYWSTLFFLGEAFGWEPAGTLYPINPQDSDLSYPDDDYAGPRGTYLGDEFNRVTDADAAAWVAALNRALDAFGGKMTSEQAETVRKIVRGERPYGLCDDLDDLFPEEPPDMALVIPALAGLVRKFVELASRGGFLIW